jgi:DNA-binding GntR family transcriptional regulator
MSTSGLRRITQRLIRDDVLSSLRAAILEGQFEAGERLVETDLAGQLGTSRGPVRDALKELSREGLVDIHAYRGAVVKTFSARDIEEIYELRNLLEGYATREAVEKATAADIERLQTIYDEMQAFADADDLAALVEKDVEFHREICRTSGNTRLLEMWSSLASQVRLFLVLADQVFFEPNFIVSTHTDTMEAFRTGDPDLAERAVEKHMFDVGRTIAQALNGLEPTNG